MTRVTTDEVAEIISTTQELLPFVELANRYVTGTLGSVSSLSNAQRKDIELYVSAHFAAITVERGAPRFEQAGDSRVSWEVKVTAGLGASRYGKMALLLDTSKTLVSLSIERVAQFRVFGG